ncbi:hypothetical protein [Maricaulis maris]|uniref:hypothetical protein n=1 Tax=Maricaulis maris TaxID=74318 RepID=UPI003B8D4BA2
MSNAKTKTYTVAMGRMRQGGEYKEVGEEIKLDADEGDRLVKRGFLTAPGAGARKVQKSATPEENHNDAPKTAAPADGRDQVIEFEGGQTTVGKVLARAYYSVANRKVAGWNELSDEERQAAMGAALKAIQSETAQP